MYAYMILVLLAVSVARADRLENVRQVPAAAVHSGGHSSYLSLPYQSNAEPFKNTYKAAPVSSYTTAAPLLHKSHYTPASYNTNAYVGQQSDAAIPIVKQANEPNNGDGTYSYSYETANGIAASEYGVYKPGPTAEEGVQSASGSYSYTGPDNVQYTITYTSGPEGFVASGAHIPTPPPIPEAIQKLLQYAGEDNKYSQYPGNEVTSNKYSQYSANEAAPNKYSHYPSSPDRYSSNDRYTSALPSQYYHPKITAATYEHNNEYKVQDENNYSRK